MERKIRVLIAKPGLDGHDRGGEDRCEGAERCGEGGDLHGVTSDARADCGDGHPGGCGWGGVEHSLGGPYGPYSKCIEITEEKKAEDIFVFAGGIIPERDVSKLKGLGVLEVFTPGAATSEIIDFVQKAIRKPR